MVLIIHCQCDDQTINNFPKTDYLDCFALPCLVWGSSADSGILQFSTNILENISNLRWHFYQRIGLSLKLPWSDICAAWKNVDMIKPLQLFYLKLQAKMSRGSGGIARFQRYLHFYYTLTLSVVLLEGTWWDTPFRNTTAARQSISGLVGPSRGAALAQCNTQITSISPLTSPAPASAQSCQLTSTHHSRPFLVSSP